jgi:hypothetical protein
LSFAELPDWVPDYTSQKNMTECELQRNSVKLDNYMINETSQKIVAECNCGKSGHRSVGIGKNEASGESWFISRPDRTAQTNDVKERNWFIPLRAASFIAKSNWK